MAFFKELKKEDICGPACKKDESSESQFIPSWIWTLQAPPTPPGLPGLSSSSAITPSSLAQTSPPIDKSTAGNDKEDQISAKEIEDYILVDWAKAQEHAKCFEEEVELSVEEMRRTLLFFSWSASEWEKCGEACANSNNPPPGNIIQGLRAYAHRQSAMY